MPLIHSVAELGFAVTGGRDVWQSVIALNVGSLLENSIQTHLANTDDDIVTITLPIEAYRQLLEVQWETH